MVNNKLSLGLSKHDANNATISEEKSELSVLNLSKEPRTVKDLQRCFSDRSF